MSSIIDFISSFSHNFFANSLLSGLDSFSGIIIPNTFSLPTALQASVADIFDELDIVCDIDKNLVRRKKLLAGGPVEQDKGFIIHDSDNRWESSIAVTSQITICTSRTILNDIAGGTGPKNYLVALGCAGWDSGQLEEEISANAWITVPANAELIFSNNYSSKIDEAAALLGIDLLQISPETGHS